MGKKIERNRSKTLPSSPTHSLSSSSSSSSDFEFRISVSPRKSSAALCPADELFYKGQLLPLHLSPRISMVRNLLASSSSSDASRGSTTASRDSSSSNDSTSTSTSTSSSSSSSFALGDPCCDSSRPSSVTDDDNHHPRKPLLSSSKYFNRLSSVFKKDNSNTANNVTTTSSSNGNKSSVKKMSSSSAKEVIRRYLKKVKPLYERLSSRPVRRREPTLTTSFSGNLKCPKMIKRSYVASCPSSMRSSPNHSGLLTRAGMPSQTSTMEELQNAIQGAIAHCKNSMLQTTTSSFNIHNNTKAKAILT